MVGSIDEDVRRLEHLYEHVPALNETDHAQAISFFPEVRSITLRLHEAGHDVFYRTGHVLAGILEPGDPKYSESMGCITNMLARSTDNVASVEDRLERLHMLVQVCESALVYVTGENKGFILARLGKAYWDMSFMENLHPNRTKARDYLRQAQSILERLDSDSTAPTLGFIEHALEHLARRVKDRRKKPMVDFQPRRYSRKQKHRRGYEDEYY